MSTVSHPNMLGIQVGVKLISRSSKLISRSSKLISTSSLLSILGVQAGAASSALRSPPQFASMKMACTLPQRLRSPLCASLRPCS